MIGVTYTRRFNNRHFRSGHLFQGRFKSILVENDAYVLELSYYIHRNPSRAGIVKRLIGVTYTAASHIVKRVKVQLKTDPIYKKKYEVINSQIKV